MRIPVFVSCPTVLNPAQEAARGVVVEELEKLKLEPRAIGRSDKPTVEPLLEVHVMATHCSGGVILGFEQFYAKRGIAKRGTQKETPTSSGAAYPSPWNHLEAGVLFSLGLPMLVFREGEIRGGIFDDGVANVFIHQMPEAGISPERREELRETLLKWQGQVQHHYYRDRRQLSV